MITQQFVYTITGGTAPYTYAFVADSTCVSFSPSEGTTNGVVSSLATYDDAVCASAVTLTLSVVDSLGCNFEFSLSATNPCATLSLDPIAQLDDYKFRAISSSTGCSSAAYAWDYNTLLFTNAVLNTTGFTTTLEFEPNPDVAAFPANSEVTVYVTDCNGCTATESLTFPICSPVISNLSLILSPVTTQSGATIYTTTQILIPDVTPCSAEIDWSELEFLMPDTDWTALELSANHRYWSFQAPTGTTPGIYMGTYNVKDEFGIPSNVANITFTVLSGPVQTTVSIPNQTFQVDCSEYDPLDTYEINVEGLVTASYGAEIDWSTWQLITPPNYLSGSITLGVDGITGDHIISYELTDPIENDTFAWTVCDTAGNCGQATFYTIAGCSTAPTAVDDEACATCGNPVTISVLDNDTDGPFILTSIQIVDLPSHGTAVPQTDGTIIYTPDSGYVGADSFTYTVNNTFGQASNEATVEIDTICAGTDGSLNLCNI